MFTIQPVPNNEMYPFELYLNGKLFVKDVFYDELSKTYFPEDWPKFNIDHIKDMAAMDFPEELSLNWMQEPMHDKALQDFTLTRKGKNITITVYSYFDLNNNDLEWLTWHPVKFIKELHQVAKQHPCKTKIDLEIYNINFAYTVLAEGSIGEVYYNVLHNLQQMLLEADGNLRNSISATKLTKLTAI